MLTAVWIVFSDTSQDVVFNCIFILILSQVLCLLGTLIILQYKIFQSH